MAPQHLAALSVLLLCVLPWSIWLGVCLFAYTTARSYIAQNWPESPHAVRKRILLTGDDDQAILSMARVLRASGSTVYVVKHERIPYLGFLRTSRAITQYAGLAGGRLTPILRRWKEWVYDVAASFSIRISPGLPTSFPGTVLRLIESEKIDLWIHCDASTPSTAFAQARDIVLKHSAAKIFGPDIETARLSYGYYVFSHRMAIHEHEVRCAKTLTIRSRAEIHNHLADLPQGGKFLLERSVTPLLSPFTKANSGTKRRDSRLTDSAITLVDDASSDTDSFENVGASTPTEEYTVLPQPTPNDTYSVVASMRISNGSPWTMHEVIEGKPGTISALVVNGRIRAFAARTALHARTFSTAARRAPSLKRAHVNVEHDIKEWQHHEHTAFLDPTSSLGTALLKYAQRFVQTLPQKPSSFLSLHFFLVDRARSNGAEQQIVATGCGFGFDPLLAGQALACGVEEQFGRAMTAKEDGETGVMLLPAPHLAGNGERYAWPLLAPLPKVKDERASPGHMSLADGVTAVIRFWNAFAQGKDPIFDSRDLVPWIWFWMVQTPIEVAFEGMVEILERVQDMAVEK